MTRRRYSGWSMPEEPRPLSRADLREFLRMLGLAGIAVVVGILAAPYVWAWLS